MTECKGPYRFDARRALEQTINPYYNNLAILLFLFVRLTIGHDKSIMFSFLSFFKGEIMWNYDDWL